MDETKIDGMMEMSRSRITLGDGLLTNFSNEDDFAVSGFYVREKAPNTAQVATDINGDEQNKENGLVSNGDISKQDHLYNKTQEDSTDERETQSEENDSESKDENTEEEIESETNKNQTVLLSEETHTSEKEVSGKSMEVSPELEEVTQTDAPKEAEHEEVTQIAGVQELPKETEHEVDQTPSKDDPLKITPETNEETDQSPKTVVETTSKDDTNASKEADDAPSETTETSSETMDEKESEPTGVPSADKMDEEPSVKTTTPQAVTEEESLKNDDDDCMIIERKEAPIDLTDDTLETSDILLQQLQGQKSSEENSAEMDEDFDPALLCPDISMDVDEAAVMTNNCKDDDNNGSTSPLPYKAIFSTLVDEITGTEVDVDLTSEEMELRKSMFGPDNPVEESKIHCTACNVHLGSAIIGASNRFVHPLLKVLICRNCYHFYTSGEFEKDEDGSELYCRWCGQGGQVLCCSSCEYVFCKKCIKNNFGMRKFKNIRDSDDWNCFRCEPQQLSKLRVTCAEFMDWYKTASIRVHAVGHGNPSIMTTDHTKCCAASKSDSKIGSRKRKREVDEYDPDYLPKVEDDTAPVKKEVPAVMPVVSKINPPLLTPIRQGPGIFRVGNTTFRSKPTAVAIQPKPRPALGAGSLIAVSKTNKPNFYTLAPQPGGKASTTTSFIKLVPTTANNYTVVTANNNGTSRIVNSIKPVKSSTAQQGKHEWFEKTVRGASKVNSNLSYTLTQLNRQQAQATCVEALAVVHNKLQEVLSGSINNLIQIRKNLRTEFISGIKDVKFPPKPAAAPKPSAKVSKPITIRDDDDVIFVNSRQPPLLQSKPILVPSSTIRTIPDNANKPGPSGIKPNKVAAVKKVTVMKTNNPAARKGAAGGGFLKVRSLNALQTVPSECITIPDESLASRSKPTVKEVDPLEITKADVGDDIVSTSRLIYNLKEMPSPEIKRMMSTRIVLQKTAEMEKLLESKIVADGKL